MHLSKRKFWTFRAAAEDSSVGELLIYGPISETSWWGDEVSPKQFHEDLRALGDIEELHVYINSGGGDAFASQAIYNILKRAKARKIVRIDGLAASGASVIAMAGDQVIMPANAMMMIHNPRSISWGEAEDFRKLADTLDQVRDTLVAVYQEKTGLDRETIIKMMDAETWMTADEAKELGFADEVDEAQQVAASVRGGLVVINGQEHDLSRYKRPPNLAFLPPEPPGGDNQAEGQPEGRQTAPLSIYERAVRVREREMVR